MKISELVVGASVFCVFACSAAAGEELDAEWPDPPGHHEPGPSGTVLNPSDALPLIRGNVSSIFPMKETDDCTPLGVPFTSLAPGIFGPNALVEETATPISDTQCLHEQVLAAPADAWAGLAYGAVCGGEGDVRLCGAQATRLCSVDLLSRWAANRAEPVAAKDATLAFDYVMPPLDKAARLALDRRTLEEVYTLLIETEAVLGAATAGTRDCPDEDYHQIHTEYVTAFLLYQGMLYQQISARE